MSIFLFQCKLQWQKSSALRFLDYWHCVFLYFCHKSCQDDELQLHLSVSVYSVPPAAFMRLHSFQFQEEIINHRLTISLPLPVEVWQPARQGEAYVIPLAEHTGSQCLTEQEHPMLHCDSKVWWSYDTWGALVSERRKQASVKAAIRMREGTLELPSHPWYVTVRPATSALSQCMKNWTHSRQKAPNEAAMDTLAAPMTPSLKRFRMKPPVMKPSATAGRFRIPGRRQNRRKCCDAGQQENQQISAWDHGVMITVLYK